MKRLWQFLLCVLVLYAATACNIVRDPAFEDDVETVFVTATPFQPAGAQPSLTLPVSARRPVSFEEAQQFDSPWSYVDFVDIQTPGEQEYEITIPPTTHRLSFCW